MFLFPELNGFFVVRRGSEPSDKPGAQGPAGRADRMASLKACIMGRLYRYLFGTLCFFTKARLVLFVVAAYFMWRGVLKCRSNNSVIR
jgi:hypothetical protein